MKENRKQRLGEAARKISLRYRWKGLAITREKIEKEERRGEKD